MFAWRRLGLGSRVPTTTDVGDVAVATPQPVAKLRGWLRRRCLVARLLLGCHPDASRAPPTHRRPTPCL